MQIHERSPLLTGMIILALIGMGVLCFCFTRFAFLIAKILLALIMSGMGALCLIVFCRADEWRKKLLALEAECDIARDAVVVQATMARNRLSEARDRLTTKYEKSDLEVIGSLVKQAMPVVNLLLHKETSLLKWGFAGVKLVRSTFKYFSCPENN